MLIIIPDSSAETSETANCRLVNALKEEDTIFLLFRSNTQNMNQISTIAMMAEKYAQNWGAETYRVVLIKDQVICKDIVTKFFANDSDIVAVSLRLGTGAEREIAKKYQLEEIDEPIKIGGAFSYAL